MGQRASYHISDNCQNCCITAIGLGKQTRGLGEANALNAMDCKVRIVDREHHCPHFFDNQDSATVTFNANNYCYMITDVVATALDGHLSNATFTY